MSTDQVLSVSEQVRVSHRPVMRGQTGMVSSGHHLATLAGTRILDQGGNAIDAGVAAGICLGVLHSDIVNFAGVAPIMIYAAKTNEIKTISGLGPWPKAASVEYFKKNCGGELPLGVLRTVVPAAPDAWIKALKLYGTMSFEEVSRDAIELAANGFPMHQFMANNIKGEVDNYRRWPSTAEIYLPHGRPPEPGEIFVQKDLATTITTMVAQERKNRSAGRAAGLQAARDEFYRGSIARKMIDFQKKNGGLLQHEDLEGFENRVESPLKTIYREYEIFSCGPWCQGPVLLQGLNMLEGHDLPELGHNSPEYIHLLAEAMKLVFSDRESLYGDPEYIDVPIAGLLSKQYARERQALINADRAWQAMPPAGNPWKWQPGKNGPADAKHPVAAIDPPESKNNAAAWDTSYVCVVDRHGNAFSATPSDTSNTTPVTPHTGLAVSSRGSQSWIDRNHPSSVAGGKRPRLTPNPSMVFKNGKPFMSFGTPGGDVQCQAMLQVFLNIVEFGMDPQVAAEAPRFGTFSFPNSFYPHGYPKGLLKIEKRFKDSTYTTLEEKGHQLQWWPDFAWQAGAVCAVVIDPANGVLLGAADPRRESYAIGW